MTALIRPLPCLLVAVLLAACPLRAQGWPLWAALASDAAAKEAPPRRGDAWVLLEDLHVRYLGKGQLRLQRRLVVRILTPSGAGDAAIDLAGYEAPGYTLESLKGWKRSPAGKLEVLGKDKAMRYDPDPEATLTTSMVTRLAFAEAVPGTLAAFESEELFTPPEGPSIGFTIGRTEPVRRWRLTVEGGGLLSHEVLGELEDRNVDAWSPAVIRKPDPSLQVDGLPAMPAPGHGWPGFEQAVPFAVVTFHDPLHPVGMRGPVEAVGRANQAKYRFPDPVAGLPSFQGGPAERIQAMGAWIQRAFTYRQVYLSLDRGITPAPPSRTLRQRAGDCKDLAALAIAAAQGAGLQAFPVLARIHDGLPPSGPDCGPFTFNHVLVAIQVPDSVDFPAVVGSGGSRYLLYDPTSLSTPIGRLGPAHQGNRLLLGLPEGGRWVEVPDRAILSAALDVALRGEVDAGGRFTGTLDLREQGDARGLAAAWRSGGRAALERRLYGLFAPNPTCRLKVLSCLDPDTGECRVQVEASLERALVRGRLALPGLPAAPAPVCRPGMAWPLALDSGPGLRWTWQADIRLAGAPELGPAAARISTALTDLAWTARSGGGRLQLALEQQRHRRTWDRAAKDAGLAAFEQDRLAIQDVLDRFQGCLQH